MTRRFLVAILSVAALALILFGVPLAVEIGRVDRAAQVIALERDATVAVRAVGEAPVSTDPVELPAPEAARDLGLYGLDGARVAGRGPRDGGQLVRAALRGRVADGSEGGALVVTVPATNDERVVAVVRAAVPESIVGGQQRLVWLGTAGLAVLVLVVSGLVAAVRARHLVRPVHDLTGALARLGRGDFSVRAKPSGIAEMDAAGASLDATAARLGTLVGRERAFTADASHQLRTRLAGLRLGLESAQLDPEADVRAVLETAVAETDRMQSTLDDLLALARDTPQDRGLLHLPALLDETEHEWRGTLATAGRPLRVHLDFELPAARASVSAVRQILDVLLANASEHGAGAVTVHARSVPGGLAIDVTDEGPGVADDGPDVFARRAGRGGGHGIGLSLARSLAQAEGGHLSLRGRGPTPIFTLLLPEDGGKDAS